MSSRDLRVRRLPAVATLFVASLAAAPTASAPVSVVLGAKLAAPPAGSGPSYGDGSGGGQGHKVFSVAGSVDGLAPGLARPLVLSVGNPNQFPINVTELTVHVDGSPACPANLLDIPAYAGSQAVPARGTAVITLVATLRQGSPDSCKSARFDLRYSGRAVKP